MIAVRPITPKKNVILAEYIPNTIQLVFVERDVFRNVTSDANRYLGELNEDPRILAQRPQIGPILFAGTALGWNRRRRKVVDHNL